jgi:hypothetical protein
LSAAADDCPGYPCSPNTIIWRLKMLTTLPRYSCENLARNLLVIARLKPLVFCAVFFVAVPSVLSQKPGIKEVVKPASIKTAPAECIATFKQFFAYVQREKPSIVSDKSAQAKWFSKNLQEALDEKVKSFKDQPDNPDFPGNGTFVGSWDYPTTYAVVGSRRYDKRAVIDVWYEWGKGTNYPGDTRLTSFVFVLESGAWKLDDIYTYRGKFTAAESLNAYLKQ